MRRVAKRRSCVVRQIGNCPTCRNKLQPCYHPSYRHGSALGPCRLPEESGLLGKDMTRQPHFHVNGLISRTHWRVSQLLHCTANGGHRDAPSPGPYVQYNDANPANLSRLEPDQIEVYDRDTCTGRLSTGTRRQQVPETEVAKAFTC